MSRLELPRAEIAFRSEYEKIVLDEKLTVVFRPGDRVFPAWRGYKKGELITARIIQTLGDDSKLIPPIFTEDKKELMISDIKVVKISNLKESDFFGSSDDVKNVKDLEKQINWIYGQTLSYFDNVVTLIKLEYVCCVCKLDSFSK